VQFNSLTYAVFLLVVFAGYWSTVRLPRFPIWLLFVASYFFYGSTAPTLLYVPVVLALIGVSSTVDYFCGRAIHRTEDPRARKRFLLVSIVYNLGIIATFKYFNFLFTNVDELLGSIGLPPTGVRLSMPLFAGISFFTFQSMSYTIDIYRRELAPATGYVKYLSFVSFFPQLVAGPIVRAADLLPQFDRRPALNDAMGSRGLFLIAVGLFKKVAIADFLALNLVDRTFDLPYQFSSLEVLVGVYGYALQIYCDFSGYSDIAIGSALLLGYTFPPNFDAPYKSRNLQEFWRRWHISLSSWLRDYLYVPLGGNRKGPWKTYRNLLLTMLLGGLWHGAAWTFVIWGALHGGALAALRFWQRRREATGRRAMLSGPAGQVVAGLVTFHYVCLAWVFFRAPSFGDAVAVLRQIGAGTFDTSNLAAPVLAVLAIGYAGHLMPRRAFDGAAHVFGRLPAFAQGAAMLLVGLGLKSVAVQAAVPFIYFQF
jgi:D-alanyl-lipoteichoic acid acyltransferase DltB (MBOAT superfamily)